MVAAVVHGLGGDFFADPRCEHVGGRAPLRFLISLPADRDAAWVRKFAEAFALALAWQFTVQEAIKIFLLTFVSPQFAARMFPPKGGRVAFSRTALHQVPNAILGVLRNVIA